MVIFYSNRKQVLSVNYVRHCVGLEKKKKTAHLKKLTDLKESKILAGWQQICQGKQQGQKVVNLPQEVVSKDTIICHILGHPCVALISPSLSLFCPLD